MNVKIERIEKNTVKFEIELEAEVLNEGLNDSFRKNAKKFTVPGFRKGKAPRNIVERHYGAEILYEDAINSICPKYYDQAVKDNDIVPVGEPKLDIVTMKKGEPFVFTVEVAVKPEVELGEYKGIEVNYNKAFITDEEIERELKANADKNARLVPVEDRPARDSDTVNIDFEGLIDGEAFMGGSATDYDLVLGSGKFIPGFEDKIIGASIGDALEVSLTFPDNYHSEELQGKEALFKVRVNGIKEKEVPEIDDEFAQDVSEFDTLEEYKADIRKRMEDEQEKQASESFENAVLGIVVENAQMEIPDEMLETQYESKKRYFEKVLKYQGINLESYLQHSGMSTEGYEHKIRENAKFELMSQLVIEKIGKVEKIEASQEEIDNEIEEIAKKLGKELEEFKSQMKEDEVEDVIRGVVSQKTVDFLVSNAVRI